MPRSARQKTNERGRKIMRVAKRLLEDRGALVHPATNAIKWLPMPGGRPRPISIRHDFFNVWDAVCVQSHGRKRTHRLTYFVQVTDVGNMAHRRQKILESGFPCTEHDLILGLRPHTRKFRVLSGPLFREPADEWEAPREPKPMKNAEYNLKAEIVDVPYHGGESFDVRLSVDRASLDTPKFQREVAEARREIFG